LVALIIGGELIVTHGTKLAEFLRISPIIIGLTVVAIGTSLPELAVGIDGFRQGLGEMVLGNVVGTDIVNVLLILGLSALIKPIAVPKDSIRFDLPMMTISSALLLYLALNSPYGLHMWDFGAIFGDLGQVTGYLSHLDAYIFLAVGVVYMTVVILSARRREHHAPVEAAAIDAGVIEPKPAPATRRQWATSITLLVVGLVVVVLGADWMLDGATAIARTLGVSDTLIGLTIVAVGTSAPELITTIIATLKNERGLALGNLIGSSTLNITLILGTALLFSPGEVPVVGKLTHVSMPLMVLVGLVCVPVFLSGRRIGRRGIRHHHPGQGQ
jgi:cation:H+ antiporter